MFKTLGKSIFDRTSGRALMMLAVMLLSAGHAPAAPTAPDYLELKDNMVPHKALYEIKMISRSSSSQVMNISGKMFYEWRPGCDAWTTDHRFNLFYEYADSPPMKITSDFSTYEPFDGESFDFSSRRKRDGELYQELRGRAETGENGGEAVYSQPEGLAFDLAPGTLFPMAHTLELLSRAEKGKKFYNATVFDGSDEDGPVEINSFIGKQVNPMAHIDEPSQNLDTTLLNTRAWNVHMAFFPLIEPTADAEYEMDVVFHDNGVISDMVVQYRDFGVTQKLVALEKLEAEDCSKN